MIKRRTALATALLGIVSIHCSGAVNPTDAAVEAAAGSDVVTISDAQASVDVAAVDASVSPTCAQVQAACGGAPAQFVRGHATGLTGLDGATVQFAMRYVLETGVGLDGPHGVVTARAQIVGGAFEACVCMPMGANNYPQVAAVVFAPGHTGELGRDVVRGNFSQRYATLGDEDLSMYLTGPVTPALAETALAAMIDRSTVITLRGLDAMVEGADAYAGLVADERPIAAMVSGGAITSGTLRTAFNMPGTQWPSERLVIFVDRNHDHLCNDGDLAASIRLDGRTEITGIGGAWLTGAAIQPACDAIGIGAPRGG